MTQRTEITRLSDDLLAPKVYVAEIREPPFGLFGLVEYRIAFVGQDEGRQVPWRKTTTVRTARKAIKAAVRARAKQKGGAK